MDPKTKREAMDEIAFEEDSAKHFLDIAHQNPEAREQYRANARVARTEAARLRALLPTLPE